MRRAFGYEGCPIVLVPKPRPKTIEPVRKFKAADASRTRSLIRRRATGCPQRRYSAAGNNL